MVGEEPPGAVAGAVIGLVDALIDLEVRAVRYGDGVLAGFRCLGWVSTGHLRASITRLAS